VSRDDAGRDDGLRAAGAGWSRAAGLLDGRADALLAGLRVVDCWDSPAGRAHVERITGLAASMRATADIARYNQKQLEWAADASRDGTDLDELYGDVAARLTPPVPASAASGSLGYRLVPPLAPAVPAAAGGAGSRPGEVAVWPLSPVVPPGVPVPESAQDADRAGPAVPAVPADPADPARRAAPAPGEVAAALHDAWSGEDDLAGVVTVLPAPVPGAGPVPNASPAPSSGAMPPPYPGASPARAAGRGQFGDSRDRQTEERYVDEHGNRVRIRWTPGQGQPG
jgi:hypothetical protein